MSRGKKSALIVVAVILFLVVAASVAIRIVLTPEKLRTLVVPRIERATRASVAFETIGVRFPFGFGVDIGELSVEKTTAGGETIALVARKTIVRAKLVSLIRRRPEIDRVEIDGASLGVSGAPGGRKIDVRGLSAVLSARPAGNAFDVQAGFRADTIAVRRGAGAAPIVAERLRLEVDAAVDADYENVSIREATISWDDLATVVVTGTVSELHDRRVVDLDATVPPAPAAPVAAKLAALRAAADLDRGEREIADRPAAEVTAGSFNATVKARGSMALLSDMGIDGEISLAGVQVTHPALAVPIRIDGTVSMTDRGLAAEELDVVLGRSTAKAGFRIETANGLDPETAAVSVDAAIDAADLAAALRVEGAAISGAARLRLEVSGRPAALAALFPAGTREMEPKTIGWAWRNAAVAGSIETEKIALSREGAPLGVADLDLSATIAGGDIDNVDARCTVGGRPWRLTGGMKNAFPALAELALVLRDRPDAPLLDVLDQMENVPDARFDLSGRAFDARPFQRTGAERIAARPPAGGGTAGALSASPAAGPAIVLLKRTAFSVRIDTLLAKGATATQIDSRGRAANGQITVDPVRFRYAGGEGSAVATVDLRDPAKVKTDLRISLNEIDAATALAPFPVAAGVLSGTFSIESTATLFAGEGIDPIATLTAAGNAASSRGSLKLDRFIAPLASSAPIDLSSIQSVDIRQLAGAFDIAGGRVHAEDWAISSKTGDWLVRGSFGFDGSLDYDVQISIPPAVQRDMKDLAKYGELVDLLRDGNGNLLLHFTVGGTVKKPTAVLDLEGAKKKGAEKLIDRLRERFLR